LSGKEFLICGIAISRRKSDIRKYHLRVIAQKTANPTFSRTFNGKIRVKYAIKTDFTGLITEPARDKINMPATIRFAISMINFISFSPNFIQF
jgi:hypothetical protein